jgi:hypothetical protein
MNGTERNVKLFPSSMYPLAVETFRRRISFMMRSSGLLVLIFCQ